MAFRVEVTQMVGIRSLEQGTRDVARRVVALVRVVRRHRAGAELDHPRGGVRIVDVGGDLCGGEDVAVTREHDGVAHVA